MCIVFVEYRIDTSYRLQYLAWSGRLRDDFPQVELYEGTDQPGLFVELWSGLSDDQYRFMRAVRTRKEEYAAEPGAWDGTEPDRWAPLEQWVPGGCAKIHIWQFQKVK